MNDGGGYNEAIRQMWRDYYAAKRRRAAGLPPRRPPSRDDETAALQADLDREFGFARSTGPRRTYITEAIR